MTMSQGRKKIFFQKGFQKVVFYNKWPNTTEDDNWSTEPSFFRMEDEGSEEGVWKSEKRDTG